MSIASLDPPWLPAPEPRVEVEATSEAVPGLAPYFKAQISQARSHRKDESTRISGERQPAVEGQAEYPTWPPETFEKSQAVE